MDKTFKLFTTADLSREDCGFEGINGLEILVSLAKDISSKSLSLVSGSKELKGTARIIEERRVA